MPNSLTNGLMSNNDDIVISGVGTLERWNSYARDFASGKLLHFVWIVQWPKFTLEDGVHDREVVPALNVDVFIAQLGTFDHAPDLDAV